MYSLRSYSSASRASRLAWGSFGKESAKAKTAKNKGKNDYDFATLRSFVLASLV